MGAIVGRNRPGDGNGLTEKSYAVVRTLRLRVRHASRRGELDRDLEDELSFHLDMKARELRDRGVQAEEAGYEARRSFGNATLLKQTSREIYGFRRLEPGRSTRGMRCGLSPPGSDGRFPRH